MTNIQELIQKYLEEGEYLMGWRPETTRTARQTFHCFLLIVPEISFVEDLVPEVMTRFFKRLQTRERLVGKTKKVTGVKNSTTLSYGRRLKAFSKWLFLRGHLSEDPFRKIYLEQPQFTEQQSLIREDIQKIMGAVCQYAASSFVLRRNMAMISILTFCGLRLSELLGLEVRDVDIYKNFLTVRAQTSKSKRIRVIPINIELRRHLKEYLEERKKKNYTSPYLLVSDHLDHQFTKHGLKHWVSSLKKQSGVNFHIHQFRHTFAVNLALQDVGAVKIQNLLGHRELKTTQTYLRSIDTKEMRGDVNKLSFEDLR